MNWISTKDRLPEPNKRVLIVRDYREWDPKRPISIDIANTGFFDEETKVGGPNSLTGYHKIKGLFFSVPAILHPGSVTYWMEFPPLPDEEVKVVCNCKNIIPDWKISIENDQDESGEDYYTITATCEKCENHYETSEWGEYTSLIEAKNCLNAYIKLSNNELSNVIAKTILEKWDSGIVDLNRNNGMFTFKNVRLRNCSLHFSETNDEYHIRYKEVTFGLFDIYNIR